MPWYGLNHVHFVCSDEKEEETIEFYTDVMGFDLERVIGRPDGRKAMIFGDGTYGKLYFFVIDEDGPHGELLPDNQAPFSGLVEDADPETMSYMSGVHHISWGVETEEELEYIKERLEENGVETFGPVNRHNFAFDLYFQDPNGINLEIYTPGPKAGALGETYSQADADEVPSTSPDEEEMEGVKQETEGVVQEGSDRGVAKALASSYWKIPGRTVFHD